jgi:hypothetical protein
MIASAGFGWKALIKPKYRFKEMQFRHFQVGRTTKLPFAMLLCAIYFITLYPKILPYENPFKPHFLYKLPLIFWSKDKIQRHYQ